MRILHIIYDDVKNPWCGGGGALRAKRVNEYLSSTNQVTVLTGNFPGARHEKINNVKYIRIGSKASYLLSRISFSLLIPFYLRKLSRDILVNDISYFAPCFATLYTKRPCVNIIHHLMGIHSFKLYFILGVFTFFAEKIFLNSSREIITPSESVKESIESRYQGKKVKSIPNGVSRELFDLTPEERNFILFLGRIDFYMKGLDVLLESFCRVRHKGVSLKIAGSGKKGNVKKLVRLIRGYGLEERVKFLGRVDERDKLELLRTCLFLVMPSRFEGWGITAVEANAAGKAVVGTNIKGLSEAVVHEKTAILVEPENVESLTDAMDILIEERKLRRDLGRAGRVESGKFSWEAVAMEQFNFYQSVLTR
jgi:glycosyltransferase involved in cell wall biosynthesis